MKLATSTALFAFCSTAHGFQSTALVGRYSTRFQSAVLEETATGTEASAASDDAPKAKAPTRFEHLKSTYKGYMPSRTTNDDASFSYEDFEQAVAATTYEFERDTVVSGVAVEYSGDTGCLVDIGAKASAFLPAAEAALAMDGLSLSDVIPLDTPMEFQIISNEDENGQLLVSVKRMQYKAAWETVKNMAAEDVVVEAPIMSVNRGGAIVLIEGLRAFLPGSHLAGMIPDESVIGQVVSVKFLEVNQENGKLVVSNRKAVVEQQMANLSRGDLVEGIVKALKTYGAFVEVGGMSGLLHISQISYDRIEDLEKVLQPGMKIKCMIIDHDKVNGRIALATKTLEPQAGDMIKNPDLVYEQAEETAKAYHEKMEAERQEREEQAREIVVGLGDSLDDLTSDSSGSDDPLKEVSDSLDSLLS